MKSRQAHRFAMLGMRQGSGAHKSFSSIHLRLPPTAVLRQYFTPIISTHEQQAKLEALGEMNRGGVCLVPRARD